MNHYIRTSSYIPIIFFTLISNLSTAANPIISSVDRTQLENNTITINGSGFGEGAKVDIYDSFDHDKAVNGSTIALDKATNGSWNSNTSARYDTFAHSGEFSALTWGNGSTKALKHTYSNPVQSVFVSYWLAIPPGYPFPGNDANQEGGFPTASSWKFAWLIGDDYTGNSSDLCIPTYTGYGITQLAGNDWNMARVEDIKNWWSWGKWMRINVWLSASPTNPTSEGRAKFEIWSEEHGTYTYDQSRAVFDNDGPAEKIYRELHFSSYIRSFSLGEGRPLYDDIYAASGSNAYARIELTNNKSYVASTQYAIQNIISWTDTQITFQITEGSVTDLTKANIHIFTGNGDSSNYGVYLAENESPLPPSGIQLNIN